MTLNCSNWGSYFSFPQYDGEKVKSLLQDWFYFTFIAAAMFLSFWDISENEGLSAGSEAQHFSIKAFHSGSHHDGIFGRNVLFTIPPAY